MNLLHINWPGCFSTNYRCVTLNTETHPSIGGRWGIRSISTLIIFKNGKELERMSGALPLPQLKKWLDAFL